MGHESAIAYLASAFSAHEEKLTYRKVKANVLKSSSA